LHRSFIGRLDEGAIMKTHTHNRVRSRGLQLFGKTLLTLLVLLCVVLTAAAQDEHKLTIEGGGGVSPLLGQISNRLDTGWHVTFGAGYNFTHHFTVTGDLMYNGFGVSRAVLNEARVPDGNAHLWAITANPKIRFAPGHKADPYVVGGIGYYRRVVEFTSPTLVPVTIFDPFFGAFFNTAVPANQVIGRITRDGIGGSAGGGVDVSIGSSGLKLFGEIRYHHANTGAIDTQMVPITIGLRW
jgi:opacity protein-like surface antigen